MKKETLKSHVFKALESISLSEATKVSIPHVILVKGRRIKLKNKATWSSIGPAKSALRRHLQDVFRMYEYKNNLSCYVSCDDGNKDWKGTRLVIKEAQDEWVRRNVIFVPVSDYVNSLKKAGKIN